MNDYQSRTRLLIGDEAADRLSRTRVIVFGVGGVGSWCVEGLVRSGVRRVTIVDPDRVCPSNVNRQLMATARTIGQVKVDALKDHLLDICPEAEIEARHEAFRAETAGQFNLDQYDFVIDAIDKPARQNAANPHGMRVKGRAVLINGRGAQARPDPRQDGRILESAGLSAGTLAAPRLQAVRTDAVKEIQVRLQRRAT